MFRVALLLSLEPVLERNGEAHNSAKILEAGDRANPLIFNHLMCVSGGDSAELLGASAGPFYGDLIDLVGAADAERYGAFGLRKVARTAAHDAHLAGSAEADSHHRADGVAVRFAAGEIQAERPVPGLDVVAEQIGRSVVGGEENVHVAVAVVVTESQTAPDARRGK